MFYGKPIIGVAGGIGSGKSFVASLIGSLGWCVINSDELARAAYDDPVVRAKLLAWWGTDILRSGQIDRSAVARRIFNNPSDRSRLEALVHPAVATKREQMMKAALQGPALQGFVWDSPLLFETGLDKQCDAIVFVDAPIELRQNRVAARGWKPDELARRENSQLPLDTKRKMSHDVISSAFAVSEVSAQVEALLHRISERFNLRKISPASTSA